MILKFGKPKSLDDITIDDVKQFPIWMWVWEAGLEQETEDETWQCPVTNTKDVTPEMTEPIITLQVKDFDILASASYDPQKDELAGISVWMNGKWDDIRNSNLSSPIIFIAVPTIDGAANVEFVCNDISIDSAKRRI